MHVTLGASGGVRLFFLPSLPLGVCVMAAGAEGITRESGEVSCKIHSTVRGVDLRRDAA